MLKRQICTFLGIITSFVALFLAIFYSKSLSTGISTGIAICLKNLIPSLFFFMALSALLMQIGLGEKMFRPLSKVLSRLFHIDPTFVSIFCFSLLGGYPVGAKLIADAVARGIMDQKTAERMLAYSVNSGPAFLISAVSVPIFQSFQIGLLVYSSQIFAAFLTGMISGWRYRKQPCSLPIAAVQETSSFSKVFVNSVVSTVHSMALICALVLIFSGVNQILKDIGVIGMLADSLKSFLPPAATEALISGLLEVTGGCNRLIDFQSLSLFLLLTGFGGICVQMQIKAIVGRYGIRMKQFYSYRMFYLLFSFLFCKAFCHFFPNVVTVFQTDQVIVFQSYTVSPVLSVMLIILSVFLLLSVGKSDIMKQNKSFDLAKNKLKH